MRIPGILLVLASCSCMSAASPPAVQQPARPSLQVAVPSQPTTTATSPVLRVVERLDMALARRVDEATQGRFAVVRNEDIRRGRLGASRVGLPQPARHTRVFEPEADSEREMLARLRGA